MWTISPITKVVKRKDKYNRKDKSWQKELIQLYCTIEWQKNHKTL